MTKARDLANASTALSAVSATELAFVDGVTSAIQTQMDNKVDETGGSTITVASGTTVPLTIQNNGTGNSFVVNDVASDTTPFVITATGSVGIGTASPQGTFEVSGSNSFLGGLRINGGNTSDTLYQDTGNMGISAVAGAVNINTNNVARLTVSNAGDTTINSIADATTTTAARGAGYMGIPQSSAATTGSYTIVAADAGEHIYSTATRTITIPANSSVAFPVGTAISFVAATGATVTIAITTDTMLLAGAGTTGSRTLAAFGMATALKITSTSWIISGNGLT